MTEQLESDANLDLDDKRQHLLAFVRDDETRKVIETVASDLMFPDPQYRKGGITEAINHLSQNRSPRILIVDISASELPISEMNELAEVCEPGVTVFAIGDRNDVGLFRDLTQSGVFDYIVKPITSSLLQRSFISSAEGNVAARQTNRIGKANAMIGTRGGVGTTTIATACASYVANVMKRRVALLDLDMQFGTTALSMDLEPNSALKEAFEDPSRIDSLFIDRAMITKTDTLHVLSAEDKLSHLVEIEATAFELLMSQLQNRFHYVFLDIPRQVQALEEVLAHGLNELTVVSDASLAGLRDALRISEFVAELGSGCGLRYVVNKVGEHKRGELSLKEFESGVGREIETIIPFDPQNFAYAVNSGMSIFDQGNSKSRKALEQMAESIVGAKKNKKKPILPLFGSWK